MNSPSDKLELTHTHRERDGIVENCLLRETAIAGTGVIESSQRSGATVRDPLKHVYPVVVVIIIVMAIVIVTVIMIPVLNTNSARQHGSLHPSTTRNIDKPHFFPLFIGQAHIVRAGRILTCTSFFVVVIIVVIILVGIV